MPKLFRLFVKKEVYFDEFADTVEKLLSSVYLSPQELNNKVLIINRKTRGGRTLQKFSVFLFYILLNFGFSDLSVCQFQIVVL